MKPKTYFALIADPNGFLPTPRLRRTIKKNDRPTAREEAIAHDVIRKANPRENISGSYPWGPEESLVLQQLWIHQKLEPEWRDVPIIDQHLYTTQETKFGPLPVPNAVKQPEAVPMDLMSKVREAIGE